MGGLRHLVEAAGIEPTCARGLSVGNKAGAQVVSHRQIVVRLVTRGALQHLQADGASQWEAPVCLVEAAGIEPASASPPLRGLHAYSAFDLVTGYPADGENQ